jgi:hypothetical protein
VHEHLPEGGTRVRAWLPIMIKGSRRSPAVISA